MRAILLRAVVGLGALAASFAATAADYPTRPVRVIVGLTAAPASTFCAHGEPEARRVDGQPLWSRTARRRQQHRHPLRAAQAPTATRSRGDRRQRDQCDALSELQFDVLKDFAP